jgi:hypothetical protein
VATIKESQDREHRWQDIGGCFTARKKLVTRTRPSARIQLMSEISLLENSRKER